MNIKIIYRSAVIWNIILFLVLTFAFIYLQEAIFLERSIFSLDFLKITSVKHKLLITSLAITGITVFTFKRLSKIVFFLNSIGVVFYSVINLNTEFSKLVLIILFLYLLVSYYYFYLLDIELNQAIYNPNYFKNDLFKPMLMEIKAELETKNKNLAGYLTNWDENGCFIYLQDELEGNIKEVDLSLTLNGKVFKQGSILASVSKDKKGIGLRFVNDKANMNIFNWNEFKKIVSDMGLNVEYIK